MFGLSLTLSILTNLLSRRLGWGRRIREEAEQAALEAVLELEPNPLRDRARADAGGTDVARRRVG